MAVVCDICSKRGKRGPGKEIYFVIFVSCLDDKGTSFSVFFEHESSVYIKGSKTSAICGSCLMKLGIHDMLAKELSSRQRRHETDVKQLNTGQKQIGSGMKLLKK